MPALAAWQRVTALFAVTGAAAVLAAVSLATASGVTQVSRWDFDTEFADPLWWNLGWLLVVPVFFVARAWRDVGWLLLSGLCPAVPQFVIAAVVVRRYADTGWGDGLEYLAYAQAAVMTLAFLLAALLGYLGARRAT